MPVPLLHSPATSMRRTFAILSLTGALGVAAAGCGSSGGSGAATTSSGGAAGAATPHRSVGPAAGARVFASAGCGGCHTLAAAQSHGEQGPDLDALKPSYATVVAQVRNGGGAMPSFAHQLSAAQIAAVGHYVADATQ